MKILDEKGKLFGKINLIDLLALIIIVAALILLAVRFLGGSGSDVVGSSTKIVYTAQAQAIDREVCEQVLKHMAAANGRDQLMANGELVDGYVVDVQATPHVSFNINDLGNMVRSVEDYDGGRMDLVFTVEANVADPITNKVGTQEVRVAKSHILKTVHFEFPYTTIITCDVAE